jgi:general secretion pathway protein D
MHRACSLILLLTLSFTAASHAEKVAMTTRVFKVSPSYSSGYELSDATLVSPNEPFAGAPTPRSPRKTAQEILEAIGIPFPEGASAKFNPSTSLLSVTNTPANLELVEAFSETISLQSPATIAYTLSCLSKIRMKTWL